MWNPLGDTLCSAIENKCEKTIDRIKLLSKKSNAQRRFAVKFHRRSDLKDVGTVGEDDGCWDPEIGEDWQVTLLEFNTPGPNGNEQTTRNSHIIDAKCYGIPRCPETHVHHSKDTPSKDLCAAHQTGIDPSKHSMTSTPVKRLEKFVNQ